MIRQHGSAHAGKKLGKSYTPEDLQAAIKEYWERAKIYGVGSRKLNLTGIANKYGIGRATLHDNVSGKTKGPMGGKGNPKILSAGEYNKL